MWTLSPWARGWGAREQFLERVIAIRCPKSPQPNPWTKNLLNAINLDLDMMSLDQFLFDPVPLSFDRHLLSFDQNWLALDPGPLSFDPFSLDLDSFFVHFKSSWTKYSLCFLPARLSKIVRPCLSWNSSKVQRVPLTILFVKMSPIPSELLSDPKPTSCKSQWFLRSQFLGTCGFPSKTTNKRSYPISLSPSGDLVPSLVWDSHPSSPTFRVECSKLD